MKKLIIIISYIIIACSNQETPTVLLIEEHDLIPEGIAYDEDNEVIYISSIHKNKIVKVYNNGVHEDFISSGKYGFGDGLGLKVNKSLNRVVAIGHGIDSTCIYQFDINTANLITKNCLPSNKHMFNDLIITEDNSIYITDTNHNTVFLLSPKYELSIFSNDSIIKYPNGITYDRANIYVASTTNGIIAINRMDKTITDLADSTFNDKGIDGMVMINNAIYAMQNGSLNHVEHKLIQFSIDTSIPKISKESIIDSANSNYNVPTTIAISNEYLFLLANSQLDNYHNGKIVNEDDLENTKVLRYKLN